MPKCSARVMIFLLHRLIEQFSQIIVETVEVGSLLRSDNRFAVFVFGRSSIAVSFGSGLAEVCSAAKAAAEIEDARRRYIGIVLILSLPSSVRATHQI